MKFRLSNSSVIWMKWSKQRTKSKMNSDAMPCSEHLEPYLISNNSLIHFQRITLIFNSRDKSHSAAASFWDDILCLIIMGRPHEKDGNILIYLLKGIFQTWTESLRLLNSWKFDFYQRFYKCKILHIRFSMSDHIAVDFLCKQWN